MTEGHGMQQRQKELRHERAIMSGKQENTQQDLQEDRRAGGCKANSRDFHYTAENECQDILEGSAPSETKEESAHRVRAGDVGATTTLGSFACTEQKRMMMVVHLD
jgi:uncharacterized cupin superfamily protein